MTASSNRPEITEKLIRRLASGESFQRGREYFQSGAVTNLTRRGNSLSADVEGSSYEPYRVDITLDAGGIASAECTCPYDWGGACKHIAAVLLAYINQPEQVEERPPLETLLADLTPDQLRGILSTLIEQQPGLTEVIEAQVTALQARARAQQTSAQTGDDSISTDGKSSQQPPRQRQTALDPATFRRQVHSILHSLDRMRMSEAYWHVGSIVQSVRQVAEQAMPFIEAGDGRSALAVLQGVTEAYITDWINLDDSDGELGAYFEYLGALWTEAILTADLTAAERKTWAKRLSKWQDEVSEYGIDEAFQAAETAAEQGWDYPPLLRILRGEVVEREVEEKAGYEEEEDHDEDEYSEYEEDEDDYWEEDEDESDYADALTLARLNVLERQERSQEYLNLSRAEGLSERYVTMLAKLGRIEEATEYALTRLRTPSDVLAVAQALRAKGAIEQALNVARHGLSMERPDGRSHPADHVGLVSLAHWLRDLAESVGRRELALEAVLVAVRELPGLDDYQDAQSLAGERWPAIREELLKILHEKTYHTRAQVEIYLYEGLIDDAIAAISDAYVSHELVDIVVDGALKNNSHHEWVIDACRRQAEVIIEGGKSQLYGAAVRWLEKARQASVAAGRDDEWRAYVQEILARHKRKYSLVPLLEALLKRR
jgi:uncharacterized Zn finger protein